LTPFLNDLSWPARVRRDHRQARRHGLEHDDRHALRPRRQNEKICRRHDVLHVEAPSEKGDAVAERSVRSVRNECLDQILVFGRRHLEQILRDYLTHYNTERPHRSLALAAPVGASQEVRESPPDEIRRRDVLAGLIHEYHAAA